jgi:polyphosphate kinase
MQSDGTYEPVSSDDESVRDIQEILMTATEAALDNGYGPGMIVDTDLVEEELLVEDAAETETDASPEGSNEASSDTDDEQTYSDGGDASAFDVYADHWYRPDSETYDWAVRTAEGERRYFKTRDGARNRLRTEYE